MEDYQLFLFDFDGLLVNTEHLHMRAYERLAQELGGELTWDFRQYCSIAHRGLFALRDHFYQVFPNLRSRYPEWSLLYERKQALYENVLVEGSCELMPGAAHLLRQLTFRNIPCAVVTHSRLQHVQIIREQLPELQAIPYWVTREQYAEAKPHPAGYLLALERYGTEAPNVVGFEDSPRGLAALRQTRAQPVLVCAADYPLLHDVQLEGVIHLTSLSQAVEDFFEAKTLSGGCSAC